jgi:hypothetical protein
LPELDPERLVPADALGVSMDDPELPEALDEPDEPDEPAV